MVPISDTYVPLLMVALWVSIPVPDMVQETGTVILIWSTAEVLSSADTVLEARIAPERMVNPNKLSALIVNSLVVENELLMASVLLPLVDVFVFMLIMHDPFRTISIYRQFIVLILK